MTKLFHKFNGKMKLSYILLIQTLNQNFPFFHRLNYHLFTHLGTKMFTLCFFKPTLLRREFCKYSLVLPLLIMVAIPNEALSIQQRKMQERNENNHKNNINRDYNQLLTIHLCPLTMFPAITNILELWMINQYLTLFIHEFSIHNHAF